MSLCDLCKNIPWETLPEVPPDLSGNLTGYKYIQPLLNWPADVRGHEHHHNLDALRESASTCSLCSLILSSAENVEKQLQELKPQWEAKEIHQYDWPTYDFFLVKRQEGGDGCWVMSFVRPDTDQVEKNRKKRRKEAWIIAALGICVREGDPLEEVIQGRPVEGDANQTVAFERSRKWLKDCESHSGCSPSQPLLPSRIIDVGELGSPKVHLWEPVPENTVGHYVTLSYCWGSSPQLTTTRATMEERKAGITISDMPATHQDVIKLTRELGIRYLWVDALCICQDERADWERESAKMLSIYSNAYLTVAAVRSHHSSDGFLGPRASRRFVELDYSRNDISGKALAFNLPLREEHVKHDYLGLPNEPLSQRAWGLQERMLSHRVLIYGSDQIFFECNEGFRGEDGLYLEMRHDCVHKSLDAKSENNSDSWLKGLTLNKRPKHDTLRGWYNMLWKYGPRKLTRPSDKLPALSGIASLYAEKIGEQYLAGLWRDQLIEGLMWQSLSFRRVPEYRAPSWSWASGDGIPATGQIVDFSDIAEILDANVTLKGDNPFGEVTDGYIKLRAPCQQLYLVLENWDPEAPGHFKYDNNIKVRTKDGNPEGEFSRFDFAFTDDDAPQEAKKIVKSLEGVDIFALHIFKSRSWEPDASDDEGTYHSLIVKKVKGTDNFERLGFLLSDKDMLGKEPEKEDKEGFWTVTLV
ncbi:heterokaryon incompatibility protein [Colletotrichum truncatum]|uniref:Heterokaryon incompatibility protein n=1 Tax=Colletotrichum truncatum TaxID=5467 RepID=A0ACC3YKA3_COLTU|nr:heterokaryon incompatibility protein [Colletotrichum truncatum]KAF6797380.1 heterokaryon incompatibility protein [Colletotrichum truncatum]